MSRIKTVSGPGRTIVRFVGGPDESLNHVLEASEDVDFARATYRGFFIQSFAAIVITAIQLAFEVEPGLILRGILLALIFSSGFYYWRHRLALGKYQRLRDEWREAAKGDPTWEETE